MAEQIDAFSGERDFMASIDWAVFVQMLVDRSQSKKLTPLQLESLAYMKGYASYYRRIKKAVPKSLLECYINTFRDVPAVTKTGEKK